MQAAWAPQRASRRCWRHFHPPSPRTPLRSFSCPARGLLDVHQHLRRPPRHLFPAASTASAMSAQRPSAAYRDAPLPPPRSTTTFSTTTTTSSSTFSPQQQRPAYPTRQTVNYRKGKRSRGPFRRHHGWLGLVMILSWILPPLAVAARFGIGFDFFINVFFTCLGYFPGHIHYWFIINVRNNKTKRHSPAWAVRLGLVQDYRKSQARKRAWAAQYHDDGLSTGASGSHYARQRWEQQEVVCDPVTGQTARDPDSSAWDERGPRPLPSPPWERDPEAPAPRDWDDEWDAAPGSARAPRDRDDSFLSHSSSTVPVLSTTSNAPRSRSRSRSRSRFHVLPHPRSQSRSHHAKGQSDTLEQSLRGENRFDRSQRIRDLDILPPSSASATRRRDSVTGAIIDDGDR